MSGFLCTFTVALYKTNVKNYCYYYYYNFFIVVKINERKIDVMYLCTFYDDQSRV